ncbi:MAG: hypothetical protein D6784_12175 [Chloroflexi bacterium]|nr:MAG: hypothetical protein D6784_12175 [Chloroflexota bacterium]
MTTSSQPFIITVMSRDRVGIVFEVSTALTNLQGEIVDMRQSVLQGYFTMILLVTFPSNVTADTIKQTLAAVDSRSATPLEIAVKPAPDAHPTLDPDRSAAAYVLTASGKRRVGFVASVSRFCAENNINILDISTSAADDQFVMILLVDLSDCPQRETVHHRLKAFSRQAGIKMTLQHYDIFKATNEISYDTF